VGLGGFFKDLGKGVSATAGALNTVDRYINPFHTEAGSAHTGAPNQSNFLGLGKSPLGDAVVSNEINPSLESVSKGLNWVYDNGISQPLSTALMAGELNGGAFRASNWSMAWHAAEHISPAQALFLGPKDNDPASTQKAVESPLDYYKPDSAYLPPDFDQKSPQEQQAFLKKAGMPAVGNAYINELRQSSSTFKYASGVGDFALRWWADPTIIAGRTASELRKTSQVVRRPAEGWSTQDIDKIMASSTMAKAEQFTWENRNNPALLNNLAMAKNSALGPRFGAIVSTLQSPAEVHEFYRVTLGHVDAIEKLQTQNALAASRIEQDTSRYSALDAMHTRYANVGNRRMTDLVDQQMTALNARVNADESLVARYSQVLDHAHELDQVNLTRWSFARAQQATDAQAEYRAGAARGGEFVRNRARAVTISPLAGKPLLPGVSRASAPGAGIESYAPRTLRAASTPLDSGLIKSRLYGVGDFFSTPVTMVRSLANARPNGYMRIDDIDKDSIAELRGQLARIPGISNDTRLNMLNEYLKTKTEGERLALLKEIGATGAAKVAEKHGLDPKLGLDIYQEHLKRQVGEIDNMKRYSNATKPVTMPDGSTSQIHVDEFMTDGGKVVVHPNLVTRMANDHVFQDLDEMDKVLARNASSFRAIRTSKLGNPDWMLDRADQLTSLFKFGTLFRLGYIPRVAGDDLAGQVARLGAANMALRAGWGVRNGATNAALRVTKRMAAARAATGQKGVDYAAEKMAEVKSQIDGLTASGADADRLASLQEHYDFLKSYRDLKRKAVDSDLAEAAAPKAKAGTRQVALPGGVTAPAAFEGDEGQYFMKSISSDEALGQIFSTNKALVHGHLMRSFDHGGKAISAAQDETLHATSWAHAINAQLMQDPLASQAVRGASVEDMTKWLKSTAEGRQYQRRIGMTPGARGAGTENRIIADPEELANSAWHDVAEYMPTPDIRHAALEGEVTPDFLKKAMPMEQRPDVHTGQVGQGQSRFKGALNDIMSGWFNWAAKLPADNWSRHPLFNQFYEDHLETLAGQLKKQGAYDTTTEGVERMATTARRLALRDTRKLVFDIAHRSDAAAALRLISPFMAATTESFQRWGRIIADKPQVVGYANDFFNAPIAKGNMQDADGNDVTKDGYSYTIDPATGKAVKKLVPKSQRYIVGRMPRWLVHGTGGKLSPFALAIGADPSSRNFKLSQNSMNLVTQGDPWFNPGVGPIVQIPVNALVKDKPKAAELARQLQVLPFGPQNGGAFGTGPAGEAASFLLPSTVKNFLTGFDTSDDRYQQVKLQIMQRAAFEHDQLGKPMPSAKQIAAMTRNYWMFSAASAFLQPMATQKSDNYQFFRDQYNNLRRIDPLTADDEFLKRYGESYFIFAQSQSKNESGIPATVKAVDLEKKYGDLIAANPELGALIVGPEGNGPFSPEAYSYQLNTPVTPGGSEMQRTKMSASDAMEENQRRLGWAKYTGFMNALTAKLHNQGFKSFSDKGAEALRAQKQAITQLFGSPTLPDGSQNPFYNEAWSKDFNTLDPLKYERLIPSLQKVATSPLAADPNRSDLRVLQTYLGARQGIVQALALRKKNGGSNDIQAKANADVLTAWQKFVDGLVESDTRFGDLHSRYLARDLGYDGSTQEA
jgi:hypothetical protein